MLHTSILWSTYYAFVFRWQFNSLPSLAGLRHKHPIRFSSVCFSFLFSISCLPFLFLYSPLFTPSLPLFQTAVMTSIHTGGKRSSPRRSELQSPHSQELLKVRRLQATLCTSPFCKTAIWQAQVCQFFSAFLHLFHCSSIMALFSKQQSTNNPCSCLFFRP